MVEFSNYQSNTLSVGRVEKHVLNMSIVCLISISLLVLLSSSACAASKVLDEKRAKALIQESLRNQSYMISTTKLLAAMSQSTVDYRVTEATSGAAFHLKQLLDGGFVTQEIRVESYPVIPSSWRGKKHFANGDDWSKPPEERLDYILRNRKDASFADPFTLELQVRGNKVFGSSQADAMQPRPLEGSITPEGKITFSSDTWLRGASPWTYIERGPNAYLVGRAEYLITGNASGRKTEVRTYNYAFGPKVTQTPHEVSGGRYDVGAVSNLLLTVETRATATFAWRASLNALGRILLGDVVPSGTGTAEFAKKPDGTWVLVPPIRF